MLQAKLERPKVVGDIIHAAKIPLIDIWKAKVTETNLSPHRLENDHIIAAGQYGVCIITLRKSRIRRRFCRFSLHAEAKKLLKNTSKKSTPHPPAHGIPVNEGKAEASNLLKTIRDDYQDIELSQTP